MILKPSTALVMELSGLEAAVVPEIDQYTLTRSAFDLVDPMIVSAAFKV